MHLIFIAVPAGTPHLLDLRDAEGNELAHSHSVISIETETFLRMPYRDLSVRYGDAALSALQSLARKREGMPPMSIQEQCAAELAADDLQR